MSFEIFFIFFPPISHNRSHNSVFKCCLKFATWDYYYYYYFQKFYFFLLFLERFTTQVLTFHLKSYKRWNHSFAFRRVFFKRQIDGPAMILFAKYRSGNVDEVRSLAWRQWVSAKKVERRPKNAEGAARQPFRCRWSAATETAHILRAQRPVQPLRRHQNTRTPDTQIRERTH